MTIVRRQNGTSAGVGQFPRFDGAVTGRIRARTAECGHRVIACTGMLQQLVHGMPSTVARDSEASFRHGPPLIPACLLRRGPAMSCERVYGAANSKCKYICTLAWRRTCCAPWQIGWVTRGPGCRAGGAGSTPQAALKPSLALECPEYERNELRCGPADPTSRPHSAAPSGSLMVVRASIRARRPAALGRLVVPVRTEPTGRSSIPARSCGPRKMTSQWKSPCRAGFSDFPDGSIRANPRAIVQTVGFKCKYICSNICKS